LDGSVPVDVSTDFLSFAGDFLVTVASVDFFSFLGFGEASAAPERKRVSNYFIEK
jgi:hypothetical protein